MTDENRVTKLSEYIEEELQKHGYDALAPSINEKFKATAGYGAHDQDTNENFTSNWAERHVAFACRLGTFV
ncbi:MAG: hypothetical protein PF692_15220 [Kiritimatiellae bacterium]|nr:hypothetical protein [Kiritimatiellia bacterium]